MTPPPERDPADHPDAEVIEAAGGVLWRDGPGGPHFAVVHRPRYDDWSLPKGKLDAGESHALAALREVREETGWVAELGVALGAIAYHHGGRPKRVEYWGMRAVDGAFAPNPEVDELRWLAPDEARQRLTYERDRDVLDRFLASRRDR